MHDTGQVVVPCQAITGREEEDLRKHELSHNSCFPSPKVNASQTTFKKHYEILMFVMATRNSLIDFITFLQATIMLCNTLQYEAFTSETVGDMRTHTAARGRHNALKLSTFFNIMYCHMI